MTTLPVRRRTQARELALQFLYSVELQGQSALAELDSFLEHHTKLASEADEDQQLDNKQVQEYTKLLCTGILQSNNDLNRWIENIAQNWRIERMAYIDRNVLRIAVWELLYQPETPFKVVINEAIDMAKKFSTTQSGGFVNGILDRARVLIGEARAKCDGVPPPPSARFSLPDEDGDKRVTIQEEDTVASPKPSRSHRHLPFKRTTEE
ncbi:MAG: transcription antitermination factor NusB [Planctomycetota bacterium]|nr:transcription antitermination factor NusB [Planctomycetota bacterium]